MRFPVVLRDSRPASQSESRVCGTGSALRGSVPPPSAAPGDAGRIRTQPFLIPRADIGNVVVLLYRTLGRLPGVAVVSTETLKDAARTTDYSGGQRRPEQFHIMPVGTAHD